MRPIILSLLVLLGLSALLSCSSAAVISVPRASFGAQPTIEPNDAPVDPLQPMERHGKAIFQDAHEADDPVLPTLQSARTARCAQWLALRRAANRYIRPGGLSDLLNSGGSLLNINLSGRPLIRLSNGNSENWPEHLNYHLSRPGSVHDENEGPNVYFVPSTSSAAPFVEPTNFVTPPSRVAPAIAPASVETNEDWVGNAEPESPPARDSSAAAPAAPEASAPASSAAPANS